jgi:hypothetical protein
MEAHLFLFNIEGYGEFLSSITPFRQKTRNLILYKKNRQSEDVYRQKSYFHFRYNTNSGGFIPMQSIFI